jgi:hypothetical protein
MGNFPSANTVNSIKQSSFIDKFMNKLNYDINDLNSKNYLSYCVETWNDLDIENVMNFLKSKGYFVEIRIGEYVNINLCNKPGCAVIHFPSYKPVRYLYIALIKENIPNDCNVPSE